MKKKKFRKIVCAGLRWEIYIHPNIGNHKQKFALSVFPILDNEEDEEQELPENYRLHYEIETKLMKPQVDTEDDDSKNNSNNFCHNLIIHGKENLVKFQLSMINIQI